MATTRNSLGLGKFYNSCASRPERGLEISALAVVDVTQKGDYIAAVEQTPPTPDLKKEQADATRLDQAIKQMQTMRPHLPTLVRYLAADGWYAKKKYVKVLKRRSYGIKNLANLFRRIWLDLKGYETFAH